MTINLPDNSFAAACFDQNSLEDLLSPHAPENADAADCREWGLTPEEWSAQIGLALKARIANGANPSNERLAEQDYPVDLADESTRVGLGIKSEPGASRARVLGQGDHDGARATLYALPTADGYEVRVLDTNGNPVWEEAVAADEWLETLEFYGIDAE